jgi:hypothetical protein
VEDTRFAFPEPAEVTYMLSNQSLILNSQQDVYSLLFSTGENDILSEPLFTARDAITAFEAGDSYKAAMALSEPVSGNLISIPLDLENIDTDLKIELWVNGNRTSLIITQEELYNASLPQVTTLAGNYPNPFNPSTTISYQLAEESLVNLSIYNIKGQHITTLVSEIQHPGTHTLQWQGTDDKGKPSPSGIYLYRLSAGENIFSRKMILLK